MRITHFLESELPAKAYVESLIGGAIAGAVGVGLGHLKGWMDRRDARKHDEEKRVAAERQARRKELAPQRNKRHADWEAKRAAARTEKDDFHRLSRRRDSFPPV